MGWGWSVNNQATTNASKLYLSVLEIELSNNIARQVELKEQMEALSNVKQEFESISRRNWYLNNVMESINSYDML